MLLSDHLQAETFILTDRNRSPARFFLLGEGKICGKSEDSSWSAAVPAIRQAPTDKANHGTGEFKAENIEN
jgi:hypothetical protein